MVKRILQVVLLTIATLVQASASTPTGWTFHSYSPEDYQLGMAKGAGHTGHDVPAIKSVKDKVDPGFATLMQCCLPGKYAGKRVLMSGYMKTENVSGWAQLWFKTDQNAAIAPSIETPQSVRVKGNSDWTKYEIIIDVPLHASFIAYGAEMTGTGQVWIDDVSIEIVSADAVTSHSSSNVASASFVSDPQKENLLSSPINLNFDSLDTLHNEYSIKQGWYINDRDGGDAFIDKSHGQNNTNAACLKSTNAKSLWASTLGQFCSTGNFVGKKIRMTGYMRSKDLSKWSGFFMSPYVSTDIKGLSSSYSATNFKGTKDWTKCEVVIDIPPYINGLNFGAFISGSGLTWVDDISFEVLGNSADLNTGKAMLDEPTNLDFAK